MQYLTTLSMLIGGALAMSMSVSAAPPTAPETLHLLGRTDLPAYTGDFDHFGVDVTGNRLFLAGEDGGSLEVFDLKTGAHTRTVKGFDAPHAVTYLPKLNRLVVTDSGDTMTKVVDATSYKITGSIPLTPGADAARYDPSTGHLWVVTGGKNASKKMPNVVVSEVDPATGKRLGDLTFDTDFTEAMAVEQNGNRLFINVAGKSQVAVVDKHTRVVKATWPLKEGEQNGAMAFDEANHRLFVVARKPFRLLVLNADTGATIATFDAPKRTNEAVWDAANHRLYLAGDDQLAVFAQRDADHYEQLAPVPTAHGAKTAILVPELHRLFVAVSPGEATGGAVLQFEVEPAH
jgi:DNA-binding beta-propeller fold protein YncE